MGARNRFEVAAFVVLRSAYAALYIAGRPSLRSLVWALSFIAVLALFVAGA